MFPTSVASSDLHFSTFEFVNYYENRLKVSNSTQNTYPPYKHEKRGSKHHKILFELLIPQYHKPQQTITIALSHGGTANTYWNTFRRNISCHNLLKFKKGNALLKRKIISAKRKSMTDFTSEINPSTPVDKIWHNIRKCFGYKPSQGMHRVKASNQSKAAISRKTRNRK